MARKSLAVPGLPVLASAPGSPAAGFTYFDSAINVLRVYDGTNWQTVLAWDTWIFTVTGNVAVATGKSRVYAEFPLIIGSVRASANTAPTGASLIVDVNKNGTTIFTTQSRRPTIAASGNTALSGTPIEVNSMTTGDYLQVDVDQIGSTVAGADLTVAITNYRIG